MECFQNLISGGKWKRMGLRGGFNAFGVESFYALPGIAVPVSRQHTGLTNLIPANIQELDLRFEPCSVRRLPIQKLQ
jgi:hypothetical protein